MSEPVEIRVTEKFPKTIRIRVGGSLEVDGQEFPWYITEDGVGVGAGSRSDLTTITVTTPCEKVIVEEPDRKVETYEQWKRRRCISDCGEERMLERLALRREEKAA